jgi:hypothetical protein
MAEKFNMEAKTTAAYSPHSNGLLEKHSQRSMDVTGKQLNAQCSWL